MNKYWPLPLLLANCLPERIPEPSVMDDAAISSAAPSASAQSSFITPNHLGDLVVGGTHSCFVWNDGSAHCWGLNRHGELGDGTILARRKPVRVKRFSNIRQLALGDDQTCALTKDGSIFCWGDDMDEAIGGHPEKLTDVVQIHLGEVVEIAAGYAHYCVRTADDRVYCWGRFVDRGNSSAQPIRIETSFKPVRLVAAGDANCMLTENGQIACWGYGLGNGVLPGASTSRTMSPLRLEGIEGMVDIGISAHHGCAVRNDGKVFCWGTNEHGELGLGTTDARDFVRHPAEVPGIEGAVQVSVSLNGSVCVRLRDGKMRCWGVDRDGQAGNGSTAPMRSSPVPVEGIDNAVDIGIGYDFSCAALDNGRISCWGSNLRDELGQAGETMLMAPAEVPGLSNVKTIAAGRDQTCAVLVDGSVRCWGSAGNDRESGPAVVDGLANAVSVSIGERGRCAILDDGKAACWGGYDEVFGGDEQHTLRIPPTWKTVFPLKDLVLGDYHGCALTPSDKVYCWGENSRGQVGPGAGRWAVPKTPVAVDKLHSIVSIAAGADENCALAKDGPVSCWGSPNYPGSLATETELQVIHRAPTKVPGTEGAVFLAHGRRHGCVIIGDGTVRCWGRNDYGQLGQTESKTLLEAVAVDGLHDVVELALEGFFSCARQKSGSVLCWGDNAFGQLGDGTVNERRMPKEIPELANVTHLVAGHTHACAMVQGGKVLCWGSNEAGETGRGAVKLSLKPLLVDF